MSAGPARAMGALTDGLWRRYRATSDPEARAQLLDGYIGLVHFSAREVMRRGFKNVELDELVSAGTVGLIQALEAFDPERGLAFSTYAVPRIRGAMLDELRSRDWMPRSVRTRRRLLARTRSALQHELGRAPDDREVAQALGIELECYWRWIDETDSRVMIALHHTDGAGADDASALAESIPDRDAPAPDARITKAETMRELGAAFASLPQKDRLVLALYYYEELNQKQIGEVLHVTESRVSQIRSRALKRLRREVEGGTR